MNNYFSTFVLKTLVCLLVFSLFYFASKAQTAVPINYSVYFKTDQYNLETLTVQHLDSFIKKLKGSVDYKVYLEANTDADGTANYNVVLSKNRAHAVENYLTTHGIIVSKIKAKANGENKPLYSNSTDDGKAGNRRVDLKTTIFIFNNVDEIFSSLNEKNEQHFDLQNSKSQIITARNGTTINVPANALEFEDGSKPTGKIDFIVKEAINPFDIITAGLSTNSDGKILQTGGMVYVEAYANGKKLRMKKGEEMQIKIPTKEKIEGMELFVGEKKNDGQINWKPTGQKAQPKQLEIDKSKLPVINFNQHHFRALQKFAFIPKIPVNYSRPWKPYKPSSPEHYNYNPDLFEKLLAMHKRISRKEKKVNDQLEERFEKQYESYEKNQAKYENDTTYFNHVAIPKNQIAWHIYDSLMNERANAVNDFIDNYLKLIAEKFLKRLTVAELNQIINFNSRFALKLNNTKTVKPFLDGINVFELVAKTAGVENINPKSVDGNVWSDSYSRWSDAKKLNIQLRNGAKICTDLNLRFSMALMEVYAEKPIQDLEKKYDELVANAASKAGLKADYDASNYSFNVNQTGWVNCDRYMNPTQPLANVRIVSPTYSKVLVYCKTTNSYLSPQQYDLNLNYFSATVPEKTQLLVVGIVVLNGQMQIATAAAFANQQSLIQLDYKSCTMNEMKEILKQISS